MVVTSSAHSRPETSGTSHNYLINFHNRDGINANNSATYRLAEVLLRKNAASKSGKFLPLFASSQDFWNVFGGSGSAEKIQSQA
jgi:hypothetical protein